MSVAAKPATSKLTWVRAWRGLGVGVGLEIMKVNRLVSIEAEDGQVGQRSLINDSVANQHVAELGVQLYSRLRRQRLYLRPSSPPPRPVKLLTPTVLTQCAFAPTGKAEGDSTMVGTRHVSCTP